MSVILTYIGCEKRTTKIGAKRKREERKKDIT